MSKEHVASAFLDPLPFLPFCIFFIFHDCQACILRQAAWRSTGPASSFGCFAVPTETSRRLRLSTKNVSDTPLPQFCACSEIFQSRITRISVFQLSSGQFLWIPVCREPSYHSMRERVFLHFIISGLVHISISISIEHFRDWTNTYTFWRSGAFLIAKCHNYNDQKTQKAQISSAIGICLNELQL
jgi:hypothetical protein